jgi:hypothetical protein
MAVLSDNRVLVEIWVLQPIDAELAEKFSDPFSTFVSEELRIIRSTAGLTDPAGMSMPATIPLFRVAPAAIMCAECDSSVKIQFLHSLFDYRSS